MIDARLERSFVGGRVEDHEAQLLPELTSVETLHDADGLLETFAATEELAVERRLGELLHEPLRREEAVTEPRDEVLAVPERAHSVELLAHPPAARIHARVPRVREQERRRVALLFRARRRAARAYRLARQRLRAQPLRLRRVAAKRAQVLAGAPIDRRVLMEPRRARARVHAAVVLQRVHGRARPLHLRRLAALQIPSAHGGRCSHIVVSLGMA